MSGTSDSPYAEFHQRLGACLLDVVACLPLVLVFLFVVLRPILIAVLEPQGAPAGHLDSRALWAAADTSQKVIVLLMFFASTWVPSGLYYAVLESSPRRATFGKMVLKLVTVRTNGSKVSFLRATARYFLKVVVSFVVPFGFVGMLPLFGGRRQGVHDWVTGVVVVRRGEIEAVQSVGVDERAT